MHIQNDILKRRETLLLHFCGYVRRISRGSDLACRLLDILHLSYRITGIVDYKFAFTS